MALFNWEEKYSVGIKEIDDQHKKLVGMLNQLFEAMQSGKGNEILGKTLNELITYTKTHFAYEEKLMQDKKYADFAAHKAEHDNLTKKAIDLQAQLKAGKVTLSAEVARFLKDWLTSHILGQDKKYAPFLGGK